MMSIVEEPDDMMQPLGIRMSSATTTTTSERRHGLMSGTVLHALH